MYMVDDKVEFPPPSISIGKASPLASQHLNIGIADRSCHVNLGVPLPESSQVCLCRSHKDAHNRRAKPPQCTASDVPQTSQEAPHGPPQRAQDPPSWFLHKRGTANGQPEAVTESFGPGCYGVISPGTIWLPGREDPGPEHAAPITEALSTCHQAWDISPTDHLQPPRPPRGPRRS